MAKELIVAATGRRKESIARVRMKPGSGDFVVNDRTLDEYFGRETSKMILKQPLEVVEQLNKVDIAITVCGGGLSGPALAGRRWPRSEATRYPCGVYALFDATAPLERLRRLRGHRRCAVHGESPPIAPSRATTVGAPPPDAEQPGRRLRKNTLLIARER